MKKCYSCMKETFNMYCPSCLKLLFNNKKIEPLNFDKTEFYQKRTKLLNKMSISGVQDKISLTLNNDTLEATATNGKYILKPIPAEESLENKIDICANEHISMQLSKQIFKIKTAENALIPFSNGELAYITKRFDYKKNGEKIDQEDFASVLECTSESHGNSYKYDSSYEACSNAIKKNINPSIFALEDFYKRIIFNYLIGNADAHLKNFSLYREEGRKDYSLTPSYDLLHTTYHMPGDGYMGLDLFENDVTTATYDATTFYTLEDFEQFSILLEIKPARLKKIFILILSNTANVIELIENSFLSVQGKRAYAKMYLDRLKNHLCYYPSSTELRAKYNIEFISSIEDIIKEYQPSINHFYNKYYP